MPPLVLVETTVGVSHVKLICIFKIELSWDCDPSNPTRSRLHLLCTSDIWVRQEER